MRRILTSVVGSSIALPRSLQQPSNESCCILFILLVASDNGLGIHVDGKDMNVQQQNLDWSSGGEIMREILKRFGERKLVLLHFVTKNGGTPTRNSVSLTYVAQSLSRDLRLLYTDESSHECTKTHQVVLSLLNLI